MPLPPILHPSASPKCPFRPKKGLTSVTVQVPSQEKRADSYWEGSDSGSRRVWEHLSNPTARMLTVCQALDIKDPNTRQVFVLF